MLVATGVAIYKTLYGNNKAKETPPPQHTEQPIEVSIPVVVFQTQPIQKPEVLWGESLTDEEWSMVQNADHRYLN
jgi:hypothetical protein